MGMQFTRTSWRAFAFASLALVPLAGTIWSEAAPLPEPPKAQRPMPNSQRLRYNRDIRPILAENCFPCHGPDSAARKADLRLDKPEFSTALVNGHAAIAQGNATAREMVRRTTGQASQMHPSPRKPLTPVQVAVPQRWYAEGRED